MIKPKSIIDYFCDAANNLLDGPRSLYDRQEIYEAVKSQNYGKLARLGQIINGALSQPFRPNRGPLTAHLLDVAEALAQSSAPHDRGEACLLAVKAGDAACRYNMDEAYDIKGSRSRELRQRASYVVVATLGAFPEREARIKLAEHAGLWFRRVDASRAVAQAWASQVEGETDLRQRRRWIGSGLYKSMRGSAIYEAARDLAIKHDMPYPNRDANPPPPDNALRKKLRNMAAIHVPPPEAEEEPTQPQKKPGTSGGSGPSPDNAVK